MPRIVRALLLCPLALSVGCAPRARPGHAPRHVLLITVDTLRADHLSCYLYPRATSAAPATQAERDQGNDWSIDRLAREGVLFTQAFTPRGETFPAISTLMTGQQPFAHGALDNQDVLSETATTLAELFSAQGFKTAAFTTNRLLGPALDPSGRPGRPSGIEQGFEHFEHLYAEADRDLAAVSAAARWSRSVREAGDAPQFLWLHLMGPHLPYDPAPLHGLDFAQLFDDPDYAGPADGSREFLDERYAAGQGLEPLDMEHVVALYDGEIARINYLIGLFLFGLFGSEPDRPARRDTLIVFAADHGEELYQRNSYWGHSKSVYSSVLQVPLILSHPPSLTGSRAIESVVGLADLAPTLCDWFGLRAPPGIDGRSLLPLLDSYVRRPFEQRPALGQWSDRIFTIADRDWRLVWNPERIEPDDPPPGSYPVPELALFDRRQDPYERVDCRSEHPEVTRRLLDQLEDWLVAAPVGGRARGELDAVRRASLEALGYKTQRDERPAGGVQEPGADPITPAPAGAGEPESLDAEHGAGGAAGAEEQRR